MLYGILIYTLISELVGVLPKRFYSLYFLFQYVLPILHVPMLPENGVSVHQISVVVHNVGALAERLQRQGLQASICMLCHILFIVIQRFPMHRQECIQIIFLKTTSPYFQSL